MNTAIDTASWWFNTISSIVEGGVQTVTILLLRLLALLLLVRRLGTATLPLPLLLVWPTRHVILLPKVSKVSKEVVRMPPGQLMMRLIAGRDMHAEQRGAAVRAV